MKEFRDRTLIRLDIDFDTEVIRDDNTGVFAGIYQTKKIGALFVASSINKDNAARFDPVCGVVAQGEHEGKTAYFHKLCYREARTYGNSNHLFNGADIEMPDGRYLQIETSNIFFYVLPTGELEMTWDWSLCEPIENWEYEYVDGVRIKSRTSTGGILIPVMGDMHKTDRAILRHIHPKRAKELGLSVGDTVYLDRACDLPIEDELNMKLDKKYFRVEVCNILGIEDFSKVEISSPSGEYSVSLTQPRASENTEVDGEV